MLIAGIVLLLIGALVVYIARDGLVHTLGVVAAAIGGILIVVWAILLILATGDANAAF